MEKMECFYLKMYYLIISKILRPFKRQSQKYVYIKLYLKFNIFFKYVYMVYWCPVQNKYCHIYLFKSTLIN